MKKGRCGKCPAWGKCHGGCPEIQGNEPAEEDCAARVDFFAWLGTARLDLLRGALLRKRDIVREKLGLLAAARADLEGQNPEGARHV